jgi:hypothetical protein
MPPPADAAEAARPARPHALASMNPLFVRSVLAALPCAALPGCGGARRAPASHSYDYAQLRRCYGDP